MWNSSSAKFIVKMWLKCETSVKLRLKCKSTKIPQYEMHNFKLQNWWKRVSQMQKEKCEFFCQNIRPNFYKACWLLFFMKLMCWLLTIIDVEGCLPYYRRLYWRRYQRISIATGITSMSSISPRPLSASYLVRPLAFVFAKLSHVHRVMNSIVT